MGNGCKLKARSKMNSGAPSHSIMTIVSNVVCSKITAEQDFECCYPKEMINVGGYGYTKFPNLIITH